MAINLAVGYANLSNLHHLNESLFEQIDAEQLRFPGPFQGLEGFREAIAGKLQIANQISGYDASNVLVTNGATQALHLIVNTLIQPKDRVVLPTPCWGYFFELLQERKVALQRLNCPSENRFLPTATQLEQTLNPETDWLILTHPGNPGGGIYTVQELDEIVAVLERYPKVRILSDEIYELLNWSGRPFRSLASYDAIRERVVTVNGFSKSFSLTSWRVGYIAGGASAIARLTEQQRLRTYGCPVAGQLVAWQAIQKEELYRDIWKYRVSEHRNRWIALFDGNDEVTLVAPEGAYFVFPDLTQWYEKRGLHGQTERGQHFERVGVRVALGEDFGAPGHVRINFAQDESTVQETIEKMRAAIT